MSGADIDRLAHDIEIRNRSAEKLKAHRVRIERVTRLADKARDIHELQYPMDVDELRARFDDLTHIVDQLAHIVAEIATEMV